LAYLEYLSYPSDYEFRVAHEITICEEAIMDFYRKKKTDHPSESMTSLVSRVFDAVQRGRNISNAVGLSERDKTLFVLMCYLCKYCQVLQAAGCAPYHLSLTAREKIIRSLLYDDNGKINKFCKGLTPYDIRRLEVVISQYVGPTKEVRLNQTFGLFRDLLRRVDLSLI